MLRLTPVRFAQFLLLLAPTLCLAQGINPNRQTSCEVSVRVTSQDDRAAGDQIRVELRNDSDVPVGETFTDSDGRVSFHVGASGVYRVLASGTHVEGTASESVRIDDMDKSKTVYVRVKPRIDATQTTSTTKPNTS